MCDQAGWEAFTVIEKQKTEPAHRCYQRCTQQECEDIRVKLFNEQSIDIVGYDEVVYGDSDIIDLE